MPLTKARLRISDYNQNRKNRVKDQEKRIIAVSLSLTSMVDMFAILVIFLLSSSSSVTQWIEISHKIDLPKAKFSDEPKKAAALHISETGIYGDDNKLLVPLAQVGRTSSAGSIPQVQAWLSRRPKSDKKVGYVTIVAHHQIPFGVIKRVIATCQDAGFQNVNLAVQPKS